MEIKEGATTMTANEPPRDSAAWPLWKTRCDEIARWGHAPKTSLFGLACTECGRATYSSHPGGRRHSTEGA
jgi:hypothetical protein